MKTRVISLSPDQTALAGEFRRETVTLVKCDAENLAFSAALPDATDLLDLIIVLKKTDTSSNRVTVTTFGAQTIDNLSQIQLVDRGDVVMLQPDGQNWQVLAVTRGTAYLDNIAALNS